MQLRRFAAVRTASRFIFIKYNDHGTFNVLLLTACVVASYSVGVLGLAARTNWPSLPSALAIGSAGAQVTLGAVLAATSSHYLRNFALIAIVPISWALALQIVGLNWSILTAWASCLTVAYVIAYALGLLTRCIYPFRHSGVLVRDGVGAEEVKYRFQLKTLFWFTTWFALVVMLASQVDWYVSGVERNQWITQTMSFVFAAAVGAPLLFFRSWRAGAAFGVVALLLAWLISYDAAEQMVIGTWAFSSHADIEYSTAYQMLFLIATVTSMGLACLFRLAILKSA